MDNDVIFAKAWDISKRVVVDSQGRAVHNDKPGRPREIFPRTTNWLQGEGFRRDATNSRKKKNTTGKVQELKGQFAAEDKEFAAQDNATQSNQDLQGAGMSGGLRNAAKGIAGAVSAAREKAAPLFDAAGNALTTTASTVARGSESFNNAATKFAQKNIPKVGEGIKNVFSTGVGAAQAANTMFNTPENRQTAKNLAGGAVGMVGRGLKNVGNFAMGNNVPQTGADMSNSVNMSNPVNTGTALSTVPNNQPPVQGNLANTTTGEGNVNMSPNMSPNQILTQAPNINIYGGGGGAGNMGGGAGGGSGGYGGSARQAMIDNAQAKANTRGGIGTGLMSNLATFGMSGAAKGLLNARKRNQGRQELRNLAAVEKQLRLSSIRSSLVKEQFLTPGNRDGKAILGKVNETTETVLDEQGNVVSQTKTSKLETPSVKDKDKPQQNAPPMMKEEPWNVVENPFANPFHNPNAFALTKKKSPSIPESDTLIDNFLKADIPQKSEVKLSGFETNEGDDLSLLPASAFANSDTPVVDNMSLLPTGWK